MEGKLIPARGKSMCNGQCEERPASVPATANVRGQNSRAAGGSSEGWGLSTGLRCPCREAWASSRVGWGSVPGPHQRVSVF